MSSGTNYTLGFVQRDGNMHDAEALGTDLEAAIRELRARRAKGGFFSIHWFVYDADDPERGYFDDAEDAA